VILYKKNDTLSLTEELFSCFSDREKLAELGQAGCEAVEKKFDITQTAENFVRILEQTLEISGR
jgi:hypothetical protein